MNVCHFLWLCRTFGTFRGSKGWPRSGWFSLESEVHFAIIILSYFFVCTTKWMFVISFDFAIKFFFFKRPWIIMKLFPPPLALSDLPTASVGKYQSSEHTLIFFESLCLIFYVVHTRYLDLWVRKEFCGDLSKLHQKSPKCSLSKLSLIILILFSVKKWYFVTKIVLTYCEEKLF